MGKLVPNLPEQRCLIFHSKIMLITCPFFSLKKEKKESKKKPSLSSNKAYALLP